MAEATPDAVAPTTPAPLATQVDLPALDHEILRFWQERNIFARSTEQTANGPQWTFYEGPPTANGNPGTHHVEARVFKDVFPRFKTMKGYHVPRKAGWDCHGLPVELAVEKELGFTGKPDIERFGIAEFNARCRESVQRHIGEFSQMTERMGYWVDIDNPYWTMTPAYVESVWWALRQIFDKGLLTQDHRVAPYCPRCGTGLSDHEVAQGYETIIDPSVYVRLPITTGQWAGKAELLIWTTTPWTLVSNTAVAVNPNVTYVFARRAPDQPVFVVAESLASAVLGEDAEIVARVPGRELEGVHYQPPLPLVDIPDAHMVLLADYVTVEDGTGLVHQAPAFGADDLATVRRYDLPVVNPVEMDGRFGAAVPLVGGQFFKDADATLVAELQRRGALFREQPYEHPYPHCWRCHTPLMYYAQPAWYIRTTAIKAALLRENEQTQWHPEHIKHGRYGDWLTNNIDWALSRSRYWGTPLPIWRCPDEHLTCVGSLAELGELAGQDVSNMDPHRPYVDDVTFACPSCGQTATRVPEVIDAWFDSGSMPFAQWGYPHVDGSAAEFDRSYPAQFISEAIDQTRGWFYTLMAVGTLIFDRSPYENVICLGHILAEDGRKMSKHLGNVLAPIPLMEQHGADALRWFMLCSGSPWASRRVGHAALQEIVRKVLLTYWNTASFFSLYASIAQWQPDAMLAADQRSVLDRWALAELASTMSEVDEALEEFDTARAGRRLSQFIDDLSNWYVRRSRARFWDGDPAALATLFECLDGLTRLLAPLVPFVTERVWQSVVRAYTPGATDSVHLTKWPVPEPAWANDELRNHMASVRKLVEAGRAARVGSGVKIRQPLARVLVSTPDWEQLSDELRGQIADELNVESVAGLGEAGELVDVAVKPNFRELGRRFAGQTQEVAAAIRSAESERTSPVGARCRKCCCAGRRRPGRAVRRRADHH